MFSGNPSFPAVLSYFPVFKDLPLDHVFSETKAGKATLEQISNALLSR